MWQTLKIQLEKPIESVELIDKPCEQGDHMTAEQRQAELLEKDRQSIRQNLQALQKAAEQLNNFQKDLFDQQREKVAELAVEIARRILARKIQDKDYEITKVIQKVLKSEPTAEKVVVHLNPEDLSALQKHLKDAFAGQAGEISFVPDESIGPAECLVETPKGMIESRIEEQLEQVEQALKKVE